MTAIFLIVGLSQLAKAEVATKIDIDENLTEASEAPSPAKQNSIIHFSGVVQNTRGRSEKVEVSGMRTVLEHGAPIYEDERIQSGADARLKIVTRSGCTAVFYGQGLAIAANYEKPWRSRESAVRWICPESASETFVVNGNRFELRQGEVLIVGTKLMVLKGDLKSAKNPTATFAAREIYSINNGAWTPEASQPELERWKFNQSHPPPREASSWSKPAVTEPPPDSRFILGPLGGSTNVTYDNSNINQNGLSGDGFRIQYHRRKNQHSQIFAIAGRWASERSQNYSGQSQPKAQSNLETYLVEYGYRMNHDHWWSPVARVGLGQTKAKVFNAVQSGNNLTSNYQTSLYVVSLAGGLDTLLTPSWFRPFGFYAGAEAQVIQSFLRGERANVDSGFSGAGTPPTSTEAGQPSSMTAVSINIAMGLVFQW